MNLLEKYRARLNDARRGEDDLTAFLSGLSEEERFTFEERAAIMEYDGGLTRAEAERRAREEVLKTMSEKKQEVKLTEKVNAVKK